MAPAAAPLHQGRPADRAGPGGWPDRQGAGRLASPAAAARAAATAEAARGRRRRAGGGSGGGFLGPGGLASRRVRRGSAAAREPGLPPAATETSASFPGGVVPRGVQLTSPSPPPQLPLRPRQAESGGGSSSLHRLIPAFPTGNAARPARVTSRGPWGSGERATLSRAQCWPPPPPPLQTPRTAPRGRRRAPGPSSRLSARPLGPALIIPGRRRSPARSMRAAEQAEAPAGRGLSEARGPGRGCRPVLGTCWGPVPDRLFNLLCLTRTLPSLDLPKTILPDSVPLFEDDSHGKQFRTGREKDIRAGHDV
ncbi:spidroin-2-like [Panthera tigris]|uniref:spidroin-2-like n=1 Tax=Panthera tigris TaxID=9694 RepID=UPI001C6FB05D|nr:spidroin-2-like [Panthera tigris]